MARHLSIATMELRCDSQLLSSKFRGEYEAKNERMVQYMRITQLLLAGLKRIKITHVPKSENQMANALANLETNVIY